MIPGLDVAPVNDSPGLAIADLIVDQLDHPCFVVGSFARSLSAKLLIQKNPDIKETILQREITTILKRHPRIRQGINRLDKIRLATPTEQRKLNKLGFFAATDRKSDTI